MFVFRNNDGTYTKKIYSHPVKYIDDTGAVRDITTDIEKLSDGTFRTADNDVVTTFSRMLSDGITLSYDDISVKMIPVINSSSASTGNISASDNASLVSSLSSDNKTVSYPYGNKTKLEYSLTYTGFKEDIVVEEYTGQTEYTFTLYTNGLFVTETDGSFYLTDSEDNIKATIGDIIIFTADEKNNTMGNLTAQVVKPGQIYLMTIQVDADYLKDEKTVYPIRIDPTIEISYSNNGSGAIEDATINNAAGSAGTSGSLFVGKRETYGVSRALMKFPGLDLSDVYSASNITSATVTVRDLMCESTEMTIYAHTFTGNTWSESSLSWSSVSADSYVTTPLDTVTMSWNNGVAQEEDHFYEFDITTAVQGWKSGSYYQDRGIIFKMSSAVENGSSYTHRTLASYNRSEQKPVLEVVYNPKISLNYVSTAVNEGATRTITATTYPSDATVTWRSSNTSVATVNGGVVTAINAGTTTITASVTDSSGTYSATCTVYVKIPNGVYVIRNKYSNKVADVYNNQVEAFTEVDQVSYGGTSYLNQMWKIYHMGSGIYSIRPMHCLPMILDVSNTSNGIVEAFNTGSVSNTSTGVPRTGEWEITRSSSGIKIEAAHLINGTLSIGAQTNEFVSLKVEADGGYSYQRWDLQRITDSISGGRLYNLRNNTFTTVLNSGITRYAAPQESRTLTNLGLFAAAYSTTSNTQSFQWTSSNTNIATVNSSTGEVTGVSAGTVNIYSNRYQFGYTLIVTEIPNGIYFIENKQTSKCIDIENQVMSNGTQIHQWAFHGGNTQKWLIEHYEDGYYIIQSCNTSVIPLYYLTVQNDSTAEYAKVVLKDRITDGSQWKITLTQNGAYKITPKTGEANNRVLAVEVVSGDNTANGLDMEQKNYQDNNSYLDEWNILLPDNYLGSLQYWYDDESNEIGYWETSPKIYREKLNNDANFYFNNATTSAVEQWNNALGLSMSFVSKSEANITYYGGTVEEIEENTERILSSTNLGITYMWYNEVGYYNYEGEIKHAVLMTEAQCFLVSRGLTNNQCIKTGTHELGHALGFLGHITDDTAIMKQGIISIYTLTNKDKLHLQQVYN